MSGPITKKFKTLALLLLGLGTAGILAGGKGAEMESTKEMNDTIVVEIWSDVLCPFCFIGKKRFEKALENFEHKGKVQVIWKSFQLNPSLKTDPSRNSLQHLSESKGWSMEQTRKTTEYVASMGKSEGLQLNFERSVVANSFDAHRLIQFAKSVNKGSAAEEKLFYAHFTEGLNIADPEVLLAIAVDIGLDKTRTLQVIGSSEFSEAVHADIKESEQLGISGVPFFIFNRKQAVSGAQESKVFLEALNKSLPAAKK